MDISSEKQNDLIEAYVSGQMSPSDEAEFEAYILPRLDWQEKIAQAQQLFDDIHRKEWEDEVAQQLEVLKEETADKGAFWQWLGLIAKPSVALSHVAIFGLGLWMMSWFGPQSKVVPQPEQAASQSQIVNLVVPRSIANEQTDIQPVPLGEGVETFLINIPVAGYLRSSYDVHFESETPLASSIGVMADANKKLRLSVPVKPLVGSVAVIKLHDGQSGELLREFKIKISGR